MFFSIVEVNGEDIIKSVDPDDINFTYPLEILEREGMFYRQVGFQAYTQDEVYILLSEDKTIPKETKKETEKETPKYHYVDWESLD